MEPVLNLQRSWMTAMGRLIRRASVLFLLLLPVPPLVSAAASPATARQNIVTANRVFRAGERLSYRISWSDILLAGTAVMEIVADRLPDGTNVLRFQSTARSSGFVSSFYPVNDTIISVVDAEGLCSLSYSLDQSHGSRKRHRRYTFDQRNHTVVVRNPDEAGTFSIPPRAQDALSALYYLRSRDALVPGTSVAINVFDSDKTWAVEVKVLGKERIKTVLGELDTIKVVTYPRYEGVFQHKGEITMWLTDDVRKIPVLMKSKISIGSIVSTLTGICEGEQAK